LEQLHDQTNLLRRSKLESSWEAMYGERPCLGPVHMGNKEA
jgi:hypothetical protein